MNFTHPSKILDFIKLFENDEVGKESTLEVLEAFYHEYLSLYGHAQALEEETEENFYGLNLVQTCWACPEQYEVFKGDEQVAYFRLRHGYFRVDCPNCGGEVVYETRTKGDGCFYSEEERSRELTKACKAVDKWILRNKKDEN